MEGWLAWHCGWLFCAGVDPVGMAPFKDEYGVGCSLLAWSTPVTDKTPALITS